MITSRSCINNAPVRESGAGAFPVIDGNIKKGFAALLMLLVILFAGAEAAYAADDSYTTESFDVSVDITEKHVMNYDERIVVNFIQPHHGIYRYIPIQKKFYDIRNIHVYGGDYEEDYDYTGENENGTYGNEILQIGDAYRTFTGEKEYRIQYSLVCTKDMDSEHDYLSLDLLPTGWQTPIESSSIVMTLPKKVNWDDVYLYTGAAGEQVNVLDDTGHFKVEFGEDGKTLKIKARDLPQGEGVTLQAELPEGYWKGVSSRRVFSFLAFLIPSMLALIMLLLWVTNGKDPTIVKPVEFYPPDDITPAEVGYIVDGTVDNKDLSSMIIYFASKGYLDIREKSPGSKKYELVKKCDIPDTEPTFAVRLFGGLFPYDKEIKAKRKAEAAAKKAKGTQPANQAASSGAVQKRTVGSDAAGSAVSSAMGKTVIGGVLKDVVKAGDAKEEAPAKEEEQVPYEFAVDLDALPDGFGDAVKVARDELQGMYDNGKKKMFTDGSRNARAWGALICALILPFAILITNYVNYKGFGLFTAAIPFILVLIGTALISKSYDNRHSVARVESIGKFIGGLVVCVVAALFTVAICAASYSGNAGLGALIGLVASAALAVSIFFQVFMWARTKENALIYGKVLGFRNFIETAEHDRLKALSDENPEYYYNIMPYAMVMGMSTAWAKKFENMKVPEPDWYEGTEVADLSRALWYSNMINSCSRQFVSTSSMIPDVSSSVDSGGFFTGGNFSGGGFGGGGFSGGGFGGGGGGAW